MFFEKTQKGTILRVRINPNSSSCSINGVFTAVDGQEFLKVCIISVPEKGKANKELIDFLAKKLKIAKSNFEIVSGETDKYKKILITVEVDLNILKEENG